MRVGCTKHIMKKGEKTKMSSDWSSNSFAEIKYITLATETGLIAHVTEVSQRALALSPIIQSWLQKEHYS